MLKLKDFGKGTPETLDRLVKWAIGLLALNLIIIGYSIYEFRLYRASNLSLRHMYEFVEADNLLQHKAMLQFIKDQETRNVIQPDVRIDNNGTVNIKREP
jgi:hypothetical protein